RELDERGAYAALGRVVHRRHALVAATDPNGGERRGGRAALIEERLAVFEHVVAARRCDRLGERPCEDRYGRDTAFARDEDAVAGAPSAARQDVVGTRDGDHHAAAGDRRALPFEPA